MNAKMRAEGGERYKEAKNDPKEYTRKMATPEHEQEKIEDEGNIEPTKTEEKEKKNKATLDTSENDYRSLNIKSASITKTD